MWAGLVIAALYLMGGFIAYWHVWSHPATVQIQGGTGDPAQADWFIAYGGWALVHGHNPFVTHVVNAPFGVNLVDNTAVLLLGVITAPITAAWGPVASLNLLYTLAFPLSAAAGYLLARRFTAHRPAAFIGGLLYGYSPYMLGQGLGHLNLDFVPLPPLILLVLYELFVADTRSPKIMGAFLGILVVAQFFISSEILGTTALFSVIALAVIAISDRGLHLRRKIHDAWRGVGMALIIIVVLLGWPIYELLFGTQHLRGPVAGFRQYHSSLLAPLFPTSVLRFGTAHMKGIGQRAAPNNGVNGTYLGFPLVLTLVVATVLIRQRVVRILAILVGTAFVLSLGVRLYVGVGRYNALARHIPLPAVIVYHIPLLNNAYPIRYSLFVVLFASVLLAVVVDHLVARGPRHGRGRVVLPAAVAVFCLVPLVPAWPYPTQGPVGVPKYFTTSDVDHLSPGTIALVYPFPWGDDATPELWQAEAGFRFRMVGGYFLVPSPSGGPPQYDTPTLVGSVLHSLFMDRPPGETAGLRNQLVSQLSSWHVSAFLVQPLPGALGFFTWLAGRPPDATVGGMLEWYVATWP